MNERLKELVEETVKNTLLEFSEQSFVVDRTSEGKKVEVARIPVEFCEKFAELIIRECIDICEQTHDTSNGKMRCANDDESIRIIKERFGIEL